MVSVENPEWECKITEGLAGIAFAHFSKCSRAVLSVCEFNIRMTVYSLSDGSKNVILYPKFSDQGVAFTSNNYFMALIERREMKDFIGIYYVGEWKLVAVAY